MARKSLSRRSSARSALKISRPRQKRRGRRPKSEIKYGRFRARGDAATVVGYGIAAGFTAAAVAYAYRASAR